MLTSRPTTFRPIRSLLLAALVCGITIIAPGIGQADEATQVSATTPAAQPAPTHVPGEVIVQYRGEELPETIEIPESADVEAIAENLEENPSIKTATPNYIARISAWTPNDPGVAPGRKGPVAGWQDRQWNFLPCLSFCHAGASAGPQSLGGINVPRAWRELRKAGRPGGAGVKVAVLDTGVAYRNYGRNFRRDPDLAARTFVPGYDFVDRDRLPLDLNGHGTHISSTIAQTTNNRMGLTGIAYGAKIMPVRVMGANGFGNTANIIRGIRWAANHGARVISMSINFECGAEIPPLEEALRYAYRKGAVLVGSSGNKGWVTCPSMPATSPRVISVGGSTESGCVANYSFRNDQIDIAAPGGGGGRSECPDRTGRRSIFQVAMIGGNPASFGIESGWSGTSMAAAHVAGAAAMVIASDALPDGKGPRKVKDRLIETARLPAYAKGDPASGFGAGILNLGRATNPKVP